MKFYVEIKTPKHLRATIEKERVHDILNNEYLDWYYIFIYEGDNENCIWDDVQDTFEIAKQACWEEFQIPMDAWQQVE